MEPSGNLLVLKTAPGNASRSPGPSTSPSCREIAGDVAGDDTILLVAREPYTGTDLPLSAGASRRRRQEIHA